MVIRVFSSADSIRMACCPDRTGQVAQDGTILALIVKQGVRNSAVDWDSVFP
jgi:hypothetical protein